MKITHNYALEDKDIGGIWQYATDWTVPPNLTVSERDYAREACFDMFRKELNRIAQQAFEAGMDLAKKLR